MYLPGIVCKRLNVSKKVRTSENKYLYNGKEFQYPFDFQADILDFLLQGNDTLEQPFTGYDYLKVFREKSTPSNTP